MEITRKLDNGAMVTFTLTPDELEAAYREQEHNYGIEDARRHIAEYCEFEGRANLSDDDGLAEMCLQRFFDKFDCGVDENSQWENAVTECIREHEQTGGITMGGM